MNHWKTERPADNIRHNTFKEVLNDMKCLLYDHKECICCWSEDNPYIHHIYEQYEFVTSKEVTTATGNQDTIKE